MDITTRDELINALIDAAELEQGLLCQYIFSALSLKQSASEGLTWGQVELARDWKRVLLAVARQEMAHLGTVSNLLTAIGAAPHFRRPNFPQPPKYYPPNIAYSLEPFSQQALDRFIQYEAPAEVAERLRDIAPQPITYDRVGDLYRSIRGGFQRLPEDTLFIGPRADQDDNDWSRNLQLFKVTDRKSALAAIDFIITQGEGSPQHREGSHYALFVAARDQYLAALKEDPAFAPARPVAPNPMTRQHRDTFGRQFTLITNPQTLQVAQLFNVAYETTVMMLQQFYAFGSETPDQREALRQATREMMSGVIRPVGEVLTLLPIGDDPSGPTAGPSFEIYGNTAVSPHTENAWYLLRERLQQHGEKGLALVTQDGPLARIRLASENLIAIGANLARIAPSAPSQDIVRLATPRPPAKRAATAPRSATERYGQSRHPSTRKER